MLRMLFLLSPQANITDNNRSKTGSSSSSSSGRRSRGGRCEVLVSKLCENERPGRRVGEEKDRQKRSEGDPVDGNVRPKQRVVEEGKGKPVDKELLKTPPPLHRAAIPQRYLHNVWCPRLMQEAGTITNKTVYDK